MGRFGRSLVALSVVLLGCISGVTSASAQTPEPPAAERSVLVFSKTARPSGTGRFPPASRRFASSAPSTASAST